MSMHGFGQAVFSRPGPVLREHQMNSYDILLSSRSPARLFGSKRSSNCSLSPQQRPEMAENWVSNMFFASFAQSVVFETNRVYRHV